MLPDNEHVIGYRREDLGTQIPKPSVTQNDNPVGRGDLELRRNLKRGGNRLGEHGDIVGYRVRHPMEIALRHGDQLGKRAVMVEDAEDGTVGAVGRQAAAAGLTAPAGAIDLADDPLTGIRAGFRDPDELVAEHAAEAHVALNQLEVGLADAGTSYPDQHFVRGRGWRGPNLVHLNFVSFKNDCAHLSASFVRNRCGLVPVFVLRRSRGLPTILAAHRSNAWCIAHLSWQGSSPRRGSCSFPIQCSRRGRWGAPMNRTGPTRMARSCGRSELPARRRPSTAGCPTRPGSSPRSAGG